MMTLRDGEESYGLDPYTPFKVPNAFQAWLGPAQLTLQAAEGVGFEPTDPLSRIAQLATECFRPLSHPPLNGDPKGN